MTDRHDAGGKLRMSLLPGVRGWATFAGDADEHRIVLERAWGAAADDPVSFPHALWVGMNPSTAAADEDDLTVRKEQEWTRQLGLCRYVKANFASYRSTDPAGLAGFGKVTSHPTNLPAILALTAGAEKVILACGDPPDPILGHVRTALAVLKRAGVPLLCLGRTKAGWPKHSSRLAYATPFEEFRL